ncbi:hypothetical protein NDU88_000183 [Pleurodeles waltl]|uniref:Uncharacterized protein n=1 Tax=Pleurodeles waltl TaxID=8319 RepID=A0AAV7TE86_PLEWA|nr:hypothetical protein NDU88_000183 [Pleurodeles waltl]
MSGAGAPGRLKFVDSPYRRSDQLSTSPLVHRLRGARDFGTPEPRNLDPLWPASCARPEAALPAAEEGCQAPQKDLCCVGGTVGLCPPIGGSSILSVHLPAPPDPAIKERGCGPLETAM